MKQVKTSGHKTIVEATEISTLGPFADPACFTEPLELGDWDKTRSLEVLNRMMLIRAVEDEIGKRVQAGKIKCPCHLAIGQEAIPCGISLHLRSEDRVFGGHRSHGHYLAMGGELDRLTSEVHGKASGCSCGMGGSMHLLAAHKGFAGSVPIVAATIPIATGAGLALKMDGGCAIAVSYFGDGAAEEGVFHESLNLAASQRLPVLYVCENNLYASHMDIGLRQPSDNISRFAVANRIFALVVDGNDVTAVSAAAEALIARARRREGPVFLEAVTYRHRGHVGPDENIDVGIRRKPEDLVAWKRRDPIRRLADAMIACGYLDQGNLERIEEERRKEVQDSFRKANTAPFPENHQLHMTVFGGLK
jgi:TPP-dependent pyruvate/acetoin dehydrogenase alpha subunit